MKVLLRQLSALLLVLLLASVIQASENEWRLRIQADDGNGTNAGPAVYLGVSGTGSYFSNDPYDFPSTPDAQVLVAINPVPQSYVTDNSIVPSTAPYPRKWHLRVGACTNAAYPDLRIKFSTVSSAVLPPAAVQGAKPIAYTLRMVENRSTAGAPANGTMWSLPIPTTHSASPYWSVNLPVLAISQDSLTMLMAEGYVLELKQAIVPEPSSTMPLGLGLSGLLALRRRRK